jgi:hypothetical protein
VAGSQQYRSSRGENAEHGYCAPSVPGPLGAAGMVGAADAVDGIRRADVRRRVTLGGAWKDGLAEPAPQGCAWTAAARSVCPWRGSVAAGTWRTMAALAKRTGTNDGDDGPALGPVGAEAGGVANGMDEADGVAGWSEMPSLGP